jgi:hypothetical protein
MKFLKELKLNNPYVPQSDKTQKAKFPPFFSRPCPARNTHTPAYNKIQRQRHQRRRERDERACKAWSMKIGSHLNSTIRVCLKAANHKKPSSRVSSLAHALHATHIHTHTLKRETRGKTQTGGEREHILEEIMWRATHRLHTTSLLSKRHPICT